MRVGDGDIGVSPGTLKIQLLVSGLARMGWKRNVGNGHVT